jgi:hypothetical protein
MRKEWRCTFGLDRRLLLLLPRILPPHTGEHGRDHPGAVAGARRGEAGIAVMMGNSCDAPASCHRRNAGFRLDVHEQRHDVGIRRQGFDVARLTEVTEPPPVGRIGLLMLPSRPPS